MSPARTLSFLSAGGALVAGLAFLASIVTNGAHGGIESPSIRALTAILLMASALIVGLPPWRWWVLTAQVLSVGLLITACAGLAMPNGTESTGLMAGLTLLALSCVSTTLSATSGRWPAALSSSAVLGLTLYATLAPDAPVFNIQTADRFAAIDRIPAIALAAAALALLSRAWFDAPARSLRLPRWIGLAITVIFLSLSLTAWHQLTHAERMSTMRQSQAGEDAIGFIFQGGLDRIIQNFQRLDHSFSLPSTTTNGALTDQANTIISTNPGLIAIEWVDANGRIGWAATMAGLLHPGEAGLAPLALRTDVIAEARERRGIAIAGPIDIGGRRATILVSVPPDDDGAFIALVNIDRTMNSLAPSFKNAFEAEVFFKEKLLYELGGAVGPSILGAGQSIHVAGEEFSLKVRPILAADGALFVQLPLLLLAAMLAVSILLGMTLFFAQSSAHRANLSSRAHSQMEQLIEGARQVAVIATDRTGLVTIFNHGAERLTGFRSIDILRRKEATCLFDPDELNAIAPTAPAPASFASLALLADEQRAHERDWTWKRPDGGQRRVNLAANPWRDATGELVGYLFIAVDVTERAAAMRALDHARKIADRASNMKSSFLANVSHEIRTPMTAILGCADLLLDHETTEAERTEFAQTVRRNGEHLLGVLDDILDISKIEAGRLRIEMIEVRLTEIVDEVIQLMRVRAHKRAIELKVVREGTETDRLVRTDPLRVRQILVNLIGNAIKFTERGGVTVLIRTQVDGDALNAEIEVRDTGIGISAEQIKVLFQNFEQGDSSTARRFGGTGLGLAISQRLARMLDGLIGVRSTVGEGSSFTFSFRAPLASDYVEPASTSEGASPIVIRLDGRRVLLVDDSLDNQRLVSTILRRAGAEVEVADHGRHALEAVALGRSRREFDVIMLDMQMPELDGYSTARELRASGYKGRIVALTGNAGEDDRGRCLDAGCDDYATKPIERLKLLSLCAQPPLDTE